MNGERILERPFNSKISEFLAHLPITILVAIGAYWGLRQLTSAPDYTANFPKYFHMFIYMHFFMSAATTSSVYFKHTNKILKSILVGVTGSAIFCSVSDIILPYVGIYLLGLKINLHFCIFEDIAVIFIVSGAFFGFLLFRFFLFITYVTHPLHIFSSVLAAFFYLVSFGKFELQTSSLIVVVLSVLIPCTFSDFVYPMLFVHKSCCLKKYT